MGIKKFKEFLLESIDIDDINIYNVLKYLTLTDREKEDNIREVFDDLTNRFSSLIPLFIEENKIDIIIEEDNDLIDFIHNKNLDEDFEEWLVKNFESFYFEDFDIPSWYYFKDPHIINGTFVHFTNDSDDIIRNGFTKGIKNITILGMTTLLGNEYKKNGGLNFAYYINDLDNIRKNRYGEECVMFDGIGIRTYHKIDKEYEIIFNPKDVKNIRKC